MKKKPKPAEPAFLNVEDVSEILSHTEWTIRKWCREKKIRSVKIGKRILLKREWIDEFIKKEGEKSQ